MKVSIGYSLEILGLNIPVSRYWHTTCVQSLNLVELSAATGCPTKHDSWGIV